MSLFKNLSSAKKNITYNYKRYICFLVILFLIQTLFAFVLVLYANNNANELNYLEDEYDYHLQLQNLTRDQFYYILDKSNNDMNPYFEVTRGTETQISGTSNVRYDMYIKFLDRDVDFDYNVFNSSLEKDIAELGENYQVFLSPLYDYEDDLFINTFICFLTCLFIFVCGCIIIYLLDSIMVNHYKFQYGIYMTFGANFKKLFKTAFAEMFVLSVMAFIPSQIVTNISTYAMLKGHGQPYTFNLLSVFLSLILCICVAAVPVFINIKNVSRKTPLYLISALDNTNLISSPRASADILDYTFPGKLEALSVTRFRKYGIKLIASTVSFSLLFFGCMYLGASYLKTLDYRKPEFTINFTGRKVVSEEKDKEDDSKEDDTSGDGSIYDIFENDKQKDDKDKSTVYDFTYNDEIKDYLYSFEGIEAIIKNCSTYAIDINSHVKLSKNQARLFGGETNENGERCYLNALYTVLDREVADIFDYFGYKIEGDIDKVINDSSYVAIPYGYNNADKFKLSVGDTIYIATDSKMLHSVYYVSGDYDYIMGLMLEGYEFSYAEYTVGAIIRDMPVGVEFPLYMNGEAYTRLTGNEVIYDSIDIIVNPDISNDTYDALLSDLRHAADYYSNMVIHNNNSKVLGEIEKNKNYSSVYLFVAIVLLSVSPVLWFFSQILFYLKRRPEFDMYFSFGSSKRQIRKAYIIDGIIYASVSAVVYTLMAFLLSWLLTAFLNSVFYAPGEYVRFYYSLPAIPYIIGLLVTCAAAFLSSLLPYLTYINACHPIFTGKKFEGKKDIISEGETGL